MLSHAFPVTLKTPWCGSASPGTDEQLWKDDDWTRGWDIIFWFYFILFHIISYYFILFHIISYYFILFHIISYYFIWFHIISYFPLIFSMDKSLTIRYPQVLYGLILSFGEIARRCSILADAWSLCQRATGTAPAGRGWRGWWGRELVKYAEENEDFIGFL